MSSPLAVAAVTSVLKSFLENSVIKHDLAAVLGGNVMVSADSPDRIDLTVAADRINLFLFQATENQGWRNYQLPSYSRNGDRISNPPLALDLSYLVTAYGFGDFHAEVLLGYAMFVLHEMPVFTRDAIRAAIPVPPPSTLPNGLTDADLADQIEQIRITPQMISMDELSKIWAALQSQYRPTAVYKVSVVLIESDKSVRPTLPVRTRNLLVLPFEPPAIDLLQSQTADDTPIVEDQLILAGYNLVIDGRQLLGETDTQVLIDGVEIPSASYKQITGPRIVATLPAGLQPGLHSVQVMHPINFGTGSRGGVESNVAAFVLSPKIASAPNSIARDSTLTLTVDPDVGRAQRVALIAGRNTIQIDARSATGPATTSTLDFPIPADFPTGEQLLRVQIDGAESPLEVDSTGKYAGPKINIT
jgi:hypothetical protein